MDSPSLPLGSTPAVQAGLDRRLYRVMLWCYVTVFPLIVVFAVVGVLADSSAVAVVTVQRLISMAVQTFSLYAMRQVLRDDPLRFPYGPGKLEEFAAFLCGVLYVPSGAFLAYDAVTRLLDPPPVAYALSMVPVAISAVRMVVLYGAVRRISKVTTTPSPVLRAYYLDFRVGLFSDVGVLAAFALGWTLVHFGASGAGERVDPLVALTISAFMVWVGVSLVRRSFRSLMDMPLPEAEQLQVVRILARHYADYDDIGLVYTRSSGKRRFVEIELAFPRDRTLGEIAAIGARMEEDLAGEMPGLRFRIVPTPAGD
jgi:cation diffusion facilitator family transporter